MITHRGADDMIVSYLDGALSPEARLEFEELMRRDVALEREVRAEGAIRRALGSDVTPLPYGSAEPSSAIAAKLAATPASGGAGSLASQTVVAGAAQNILGAIFGTTLGVTILSVVGIAGLVLGIFLIAPMIREADPSGGTEQAIPQNPTTGAAHTPVAKAPEAVTLPSPGQQRAETYRGDNSRQLGTTLQQPARDNPSSLPATAQGRKSTASNAAADADQTTAVDTMISYLRAGQENTPRLIRKDSVKLNLKVEE